MCSGCHYFRSTSTACVSHSLAARVTRRRDAAVVRCRPGVGTVQTPPLRARSPPDHPVPVAVEQPRDPVVDVRVRLAPQQHLAPLVHPLVDLRPTDEALETVERRPLLVTRRRRTARSQRRRPRRPRSVRRKSGDVIAE